jgi:hypothetical protein
LYFANGFFLQGTESAKLLNVFLMGLGATLAAMWAGKSGGPLGAWLSLGMIMTFPMYSVNAWTAHTEVVLSFFLILFFYCLFQIGEEGDKDQDSRLILGLGLFGGAALSVKYTALPPLMAGIFILGFNKIFPAGKKRWIFPVIALLIAALQDVPWFLKNYLYSGNPFYPYFSSFFSGRKIPPFLMDALLRDHMATFSSGEPLWKIPLRWFSIQWDRSNGPLFFSFIPFLIFGFIKGKVPKYLSLLVGLYFIFGFSISSQLRLMVPAFVLFYLLAGWVAGSVENRIWARTWAGVVAVYGFLALGTLLNLSLHFYHIDDLWLKGWNREDYLRRLPLTSTYYDLTEKCGEVVPSGNQLLIAGDARGLYYPRPFITNSNFDDQVLAKLAREEKDAEGIQHRLRQMGVDDLVVSATEGIRLAPQLSYYHLTLEEWKKLDDFMRRGTDLLYTGVHGAIYGVRGRLGPEDPLKPDLLLLFSDPTQGIQQKLRI